MNSLTVKNLTATVAGQKILSNLSLTLKEGEVLALMGSNGSGKSSLSKVLMGHPDYQLETGEIKFLNQDLREMPIEERSKAGMACIWQNPPAIKGVELFSLLNLIQEIHDGDYAYDLANSLLFRETNLNFSGGEKKIAELIQALNQKPKLLIIDELDSGLDIENLDQVLQALGSEIKKQKIAVILITHSGEVLEAIKPDRIAIMYQGEIICQSQDVKKVLASVKQYGYQKCISCQDRF